MCTEATKNETAENTKRRDANELVLPTGKGGRRKIVIQPALQKELEKAQTLQAYLQALIVKAYKSRRSK